LLQPARRQVTLVEAWLFALRHPEAFCAAPANPARRAAGRRRCP
jgi:hypothetical protein